MNSSLLLNGYAREIDEKLNAPNDVLLIIFMYLLDKMEWNEYFNAAVLKFEKNEFGSYVAGTENGLDSDRHIGLCVANYVINSNQCKKYSWTVDIIEISTLSPMYFGFVILPINEKIIDNPFNPFKFLSMNNHIGISFQYRKLKVYTENNNIKTVETSNVPYQWFKFTIDFVEKQCFVYHNQEQIYEDKKKEIPLNLYPASQEFHGHLEILPTVLVSSGAKYCIRGKAIDDDKILSWD